MSTNEVLDAIREGNRVTRIRLGQASPEYVYLRSNTEVRMAVVPLIERESEAAWAAAAAVDAPDNAYGTEVRDKTLRVHTLFYALRVPGREDEKVFQSPEQLGAELEDADINWLSDQYQSVADYSSPTLDGMSDDALAELKKALETIEWSALSGKAWWHLKAFFMTLTVDQLQGNLSSRSSILNLIGMSDENESTLGA